MLTALASRRLICRLLIGVLVSTQLAIAAYACTGLSHMPMAEQDRPAGATMAMAGFDPVGPIGADLGAVTDQGNGMGIGCGRLDDALPNLCLAHCQYGQQSADHSPTPTVPAALLTSRYTLPPLAEGCERTGPASWPDAAPAAASPHAVLHCCLRL